MAKITILGCGFGTALAVMAHRYGHIVTLWSLNKNELDDIARDGENKRLLPGVTISKEITLTTDLSVVKYSDFIIIAVPSIAMRSVAKLLQSELPDGKIIVSVAKGFELGTLKTMSQIINEELPNNPVVVLSGPSHAEELARDMATTLVSASTDEVSSKYIRDVLSNKSLRIYSNSDVIGVQLGGALKNVIAIAAGILDGLKIGDNAKAALMTRGLKEIACLGVHYGAKKETFTGLTGIGDLIVTCNSLHSRNNRCGRLIGEGLKPEDAVKAVGMTVEGYTTAKSAYELMKESNV
ncbi:MAG: NAD(P)H-dependent glycerol-3-phosphate dehydrogenase, partial [Clostridia bacterium]